MPRITHKKIPSVVSKIDNIWPAPKPIRFNTQRAKELADKNPDSWVVVGRRVGNSLISQIARGVLVDFRSCYTDYRVVSRKRNGYTKYEVDVYIMKKTSK